ncbi:hypothetical protein D3C83_198660 [compost metagenome]
MQAAELQEGILAAIAHDVTADVDQALAEAVAAHHHLQEGAFRGEADRDVFIVGVHAD